MAKVKKAESKGKVALDFDGVLHQYNGTFTEIPHGQPVEGAQEFVLYLLEQDYQPFVHTSRVSAVHYHDGLRVVRRTSTGFENPILLAEYAIRDWLLHHGFHRPWAECVDITADKRPAIAYVDDRAIRFEGNFRPTMGWFQDLSAWWRRS